MPACHPCCRGHKPATVSCHPCWQGPCMPVRVPALPLLVFTKTPPNLNNPTTPKQLKSRGSRKRVARSPKREEEKRKVAQVRLTTFHHLWRKRAVVAQQTAHSFTALPRLRQDTLCLVLLQTQTVNTCSVI